MTNIKDIYCIDISIIENMIVERIGDNEYVRNDIAYMEDHEPEAAMLVKLKAKLKPIQPLIEDAFNEGVIHGCNPDDTSKDSEVMNEYINTNQFEL